MSNRSFGSLLRFSRTARGLTQLDVARGVNESDRTVSNWENETVKPTVKQVVTLGDFFGGDFTARALKNSANYRTNRVYRSRKVIPTHIEGRMLSRTAKATLSKNGKELTLKIAL